MSPSCSHQSSLFQKLGAQSAKDLEEPMLPRGPALGAEDVNMNGGHDEGIVEFGSEVFT